MNKSEAQIMKEIEVAVSAAGHKIFRVNVGEGFLYRTQPTQATLDLENKRSRWFKSGPPQGYSDLSGVAYPSGKAILSSVRRQQASRRCSSACSCWRCWQRVPMPVSHAAPRRRWRFAR